MSDSVSPPGSPVPGILQARTLEWVTISFSNGWKSKVKGKLLSRVWLFATPWTAAYQAPSPWDFPGNSTGVGCHCLLWYNEDAAAAAKSLQSCLTLWDHIDGSPPGSTILGILQARTLEWVAISFLMACKWSWKCSLELFDVSHWGILCNIVALPSKTH